MIKNKLRIILFSILILMVAGISYYYNRTTSSRYTFFLYQKNSSPNSFDIYYIQNKNGKKNFLRRRGRVFYEIISPDLYLFEDDKNIYDIYSNKATGFIEPDSIKEFSFLGHLYPVIEKDSTLTFPWGDTLYFYCINDTIINNYKFNKVVKVIVPPRPSSDYGNEFLDYEILFSIDDKLVIEGKQIVSGNRNFINIYYKLIEKKRISNKEFETWYEKSKRIDYSSFW